MSNGAGAQSESGIDRTVPSSEQKENIRVCMAVDGRCCRKGVEVTRSCGHAALLKVPASQGRQLSRRTRGGVEAGRAESLACRQAVRFVLRRRSREGQGALLARQRHRYVLDRPAAAE